MSSLCSAVKYCNPKCQVVIVRDNWLFVVMCRLFLGMCQKVCVRVVVLSSVSC